MTNVIKFPDRRAMATSELATADLAGDIAQNAIANECGMFWQVCADLRRAAGAGRRRTVNSCLDELAAVQMHSERFALRKMAEDILREFRGVSGINAMSA